MTTTTPYYEIPVDPESTQSGGYCVNISFGGGKAVEGFLVDTGSVGLLVSDNYISDLNVINTKKLFSFSCGSNAGTIYVGYWGIADLTITPNYIPYEWEDDVIPVKIAKMMIRVATAGYGEGVRMLGVGFGIDPSLVNEPSFNPFLMVEEMVAGTMTPGYVIKKDRIILGIDPALTEGFTNFPLKFIKPDPSALQPIPPAVTTTTSNYGEPTLQLTITVPGSESVTFPVRVLMDTGLSNTNIEVPHGAPDYKSPLVKGTSVQVMVGQTPFYQFVVGDGDPKDWQAAWNYFSEQEAFINTGRRALGEIDYMYNPNSSGGKLGFLVRPTKK